MFGIGFIWIVLALIVVWLKERGTCLTSDFQWFVVILLGLGVVCLGVIARGIFAIRDAIKEVKTWLNQVPY